VRLPITLLLAASWLYAAAPVINELRPRGAQKGRPLTLTVIGTALGQGPTIFSTLPATFTALAPEKPGMDDKYATFLVEPTAEWSVGIYPMRIRAANGISNILLFSVGAFPEITEEESRPGSAPHQNDSIEKAQTIPSTPVTLNGTLGGPERDVYRLQVRAGEKRVFEVDARRCGSAVDAVIRVMDGAGKVIARSDDDPLLSLDPRLQITFPKDGYYYVEVHDARFSAQTQNFYRLKTGSYDIAEDIFPLGGKRGESVEVTLSGRKVKADLGSVKTPQIFVNLPESPSLPLPFAVGEYPETQEPVQGALTAPITINGRLSKPAEIDKYQFNVKPGEEFVFALQARELGTSKLTGLITIFDDAGKRLDSAGDGALPVDTFAVQASSRTLGDPYLQFKVPDGVHRITVAVEDLAQRGGARFAYRLTAYPAAFDLKTTITTPYVNIPAGGTALVTVNVERQGYTGPIRIEAKGLPGGVALAGGDIPAEMPDPLNRMVSRRAVLTLTAPVDVKVTASEISLIATTADGKFTRQATGLGYSIGVAGASSQGVVDRQRSLTGAWLGHELPVAMTDASPATLAIKLEGMEKKESGFAYRIRWKWSVTNAMYRVPETVSTEVPNFIDLRVIEMAVDKTDRTTGTFVVTSTKNTLPARYNLLVSGRLMVDGAPQDIYSPVMTFDLPALETEEKPANATAAAAR